MIRTFRPWQVFQHLNNNNHIQLTIPTVPGTLSRTVFSLETMLLIAAARIVDARIILEIGTSMGYTALHLAMNVEAEIITLDILSKPVVFESTPYNRRIERVIGNSASFAPRSTDFVFIDADHSAEAVLRDTDLAMRCNPKVIAWHDYSNPMEPGVMKVLSDFAESHDLIHIQDTWLAFWFRDGLKDISQ